MQQVDGIWLPDGEKHLVKMIHGAPRINGKGTYQHHKLEAAMKYVRHWNCALDIGMHVGLWAMHLAKRFKTVVGFEPVAEHIACLELNMRDFKNYQVHCCALGNRKASVGLKFLNGSTGSTQIADDGEGISMVRLDDFEFPSVDFIKIDVENYEYFVVEGGERIIKTHKPVIILEQKGDKTSDRKFTYGKERHDAKKLLEAWGAKEKFQINGDFCMTW